jgi:hypothetical protein
MVGGVGLLVNLMVMASFLAFSSLTDWRASALACLVANIQNFILTDSWDTSTVPTDSINSAPTIPIYGNPQPD